MLRLSKLTDYSIVLMTYLARDPMRLHSASDMTAHTQIALPTVTKILKILTRHGLLTSQRGTSGGYTLAKSPETIAITAIIEAVEGDLGLTECSHALSHCLFEPGCATRSNWRLINRVIYEALATISLARMALPLQAQDIAIPLTKILQKQTIVTG